MQSHTRMAKWLFNMLFTRRRRKEKKKDILTFLDERNCNQAKLGIHIIVNYKIDERPTIVNTTNSSKLQRSVRCIVYLVEQKSKSCKNL